MKHPDSYVGVTGFMRPGEITATLTVWPETTERKLMVGILVSSKTLMGVQNKWPGRYPHVNVVSKLLVDDPRVLNLVHYNTDHPDRLGADLKTMHESFGPHLHGFQLNMVWPEPSALLDYRMAGHTDSFIVLQIGARALREFDGSNTLHLANQLAYKIGRYEECADAILIDPSGGLGLPFDPVKAMLYLRAITDKGIAIGMGVAGGLGPNRMDLDPLGELFEVFPRLNIDAEGKLRTPHPEDALNVAAVLMYVGGIFTMVT